MLCARGPYAGARQRGWTTVWVTVNRQFAEEVKEARMESGATSAVSGAGSKFGMDMTNEWNIDDGQKASIVGLFPALMLALLSRDESEVDNGRPS